MTSPIGTAQASSQAQAQATATSRGELSKATLSNLDDPSADPITVDFNPTQYTLSKSNSWSTTKVVGSNVPKLEFSSGGATSLSLELLFDTYEKGTDVRDQTNKIFELAKISDKTKDQTTGVARPPRVMFSWGKTFNFPAVVTSLSINYTLFLSDGTPVRAKVSLSLQESEDSEKKSGQNPTTRGMLGHKIYIVKPGETIAWIAYQEYGDSSEWRQIAEANNLDNPRDLKPGQPLAIRPLES